MCPSTRAGGGSMSSHGAIPTDPRAKDHAALRPQAGAGPGLWWCLLCPDPCSALSSLQEALLSH